MIGPQAALPCYRLLLVLAVTGLLVCSLVSCSGQPSVVTPLASELSKVLSGESLLGDAAGELVLPEDHVFTVNDEMKAFLHAYVPAQGRPQNKVRRLTYALMRPGILGVRYDPMKTHSAENTFYFQQGNCLSFSILFVALARELGLRVYFNEVELPPAWDMKNENSFVFYRHVNVLVKPRMGMTQVVDLKLQAYDKNYRQRVITDREAEAQYYNNKAVEYLFVQNKFKAFRYFRKALQLNPRGAYIWSNLGSLYRRHDLLVEAEAAFRQALTLSPADAVAMSNLARVYKQRGDLEKAAIYLQQVKRFRLRNPYYRYTQAQQAYNRGDNPLALSHMQAAIKQRPDEYRFHDLVAEIYQSLGDLTMARKSLERASELVSDASDNLLMDQYQSRLQQLMAVY